MGVLIQVQIKQAAKNLGQNSLNRMGRAKVLYLTSG